MGELQIPEDDCKKLMDEFEKIKEGMSNNKIMVNYYQLQKRFWMWK